MQHPPICNAGSSRHSASIRLSLTLSLTLSLSLCLSLAATAHSASAACTGDCDGGGDVTVDEILKAVNIALEVRPVTDCSAADENADGTVTVDELISAVSHDLNGCPPGAIFPANYRDTYKEVRDCRFSIEHDGVNIRVLTNPESEAAYLNNNNPMPVGSIVIKEEFGGGNCNDANLLRWRVMKKEAPGFDSEDGDWRWQWLNRDGTIIFNDKATCIGCHDRPACLARDRMCTVGGADNKIDLPIRNMPAALLSIAGTSATDVYTVGADPDGDSFGPYVLHYDGTRWTRLNTGATGGLWWISVTPINSAFYMAGDNGLVLRFDLDTHKFSRLDVPAPTQTLFGIWGDAANNLYACGGDVADEDFGGALWHYDGSMWSSIDLSAVLPGGVPTLYKVWGRSANDVWVVGREGAVLHFDGTSWSKINSNSVRPLFTVHGNADRVVATGGFADGVILEYNGTSFTDATPLGTPQMNGVFMAPDGSGVTVGIAGAFARRTNLGWELPDTGLSTARDFHGSWIDPEGGVWAVGGDLSVALTSGIVGYAGQRTISGEVVPLSLCPAPPANPSSTGSVSYARDIVPILADRGCLSPACHGGVFPSSGYDLRAYQGIFGPGVLARSRQLCEVTPGNPDTSFLIEKLGAMPRVGGSMPPAPRPLLPSEEIDLLRTWILEGAVDDRNATPTPTPTATRPPVMTPTPSVATTPLACGTPGNICTVAGTGQALFNGDGKPATQTSLYYPLGVTFESAGTALLVDWNNLRIRRLQSDGTVITIMGKSYEDSPVDGALASDTALHHASDVVFDTLGQMYVAGDHAPVVFRVGLDNRVFIVAGNGDVGNSGDGGPARQATLSTPFGLAAIGDDIYVTDIDAHVVRRIATDGTISTVAGNGTLGHGGDGPAATAIALGGPAGIDSDAAGNLYFAETKNHRVRRLNRDGSIVTVAGSGTRGFDGDNGPATDAKLNGPYDVRIGPDGLLYIADTGNSVIRRVRADGVIETIAGTGVSGFGGDSGSATAAQFDRPSGIAFAPDGALWIADTFNNRVRRLAR